MPDARPFSFMRRLQEIGMFFEKRSPQHKAMRLLARRLEKAGIPYAVMGAMAVNAHGAERTTKDVDVFVTAEGLVAFRQHFVPRFYAPFEKLPRRFEDRVTRRTVDFLVKGLFPGTGKPGPVTRMLRERFHQLRLHALEILLGTLGVDDQFLLGGVVDHGLGGGWLDDFTQFGVIGIAVVLAAGAALLQDRVFL